MEVTRHFLAGRTAAALDAYLLAVLLAQANQLLMLAIPVPEAVSSETRLSRVLDADRGRNSS
jgi:hypothetical protein